MTLKICDRCGVNVSGVPAALAVSLPIDDPATKPNKVTADPFPVTIGLALVEVRAGQTVDLCPFCYGSALVEAAAQLMTGQGLSDKQSNRLAARIASAVAPS